MKFNSIRDLWEHQAKKYRDNVVLFCVDEDRKITYEEMYNHIKKTANLLLKLGIKKRDKVAFITSNIPEFFYIFYGCLSIGAVTAPISYSSTKNEIEELLDFCDAKILFVENQFVENIKGIKIKKIIIRNDKNDFNDMIKKQPEKLKEIKVEQNDDAYLTFTSGTTGKPKGILITHLNLLTKFTSGPKIITLNPGDRWLCNQQLYYQDHTTYFGYPFGAGASCVMPKKFSKSKFWDIVEKYKIKYTVLFPTMAQILLKVPEDISKRDLSSVRCFFIGGSEVSIELIKKFEKTFNILLIQGYGLNEVISTVCVNPISKEKRKINSMGIPTQINKFKVVDENGKELAPMKTGELLIKGSGVMKEYYKDSELTKKTIIDGWLHTGDAVYFDKEGFLYFVGRIKNIIKRGGESISPAEIDNVIHKHKAVHDSVTIGVPDEIYGEEIKSYIVLKKKVKIKEQDIIDYCRQYLGKTKIPKYIEFIKEIPVTNTDKPDIKKLKKMHKN